MELYFHSRFVTSWRGQGRLRYFVLSLTFLFALLVVLYYATSLCSRECCAWTESPRTKGIGNVVFYKVRNTDSRNILCVSSTVHHSIELFHQPTLIHNFLYSLTICLLHYYPRYVSSINMPIFRRKSCIHTASGIFALCKRLHSTPVERTAVRSQPVYCADIYRERRYQMLCEYNFSS